MKIKKVIYGMIMSIMVNKRSEKMILIKEKEEAIKKAKNYLKEYKGV